MKWIVLAALVAACGSDELEQLDATDAGEFDAGDAGEFDAGDAGELDARTCGGPFMPCCPGNDVRCEQGTLCNSSEICEPECFPFCSDGGT